MKFYNTAAINGNIYCDKNMIQSFTKIPILNFHTAKAASYG